MLKKIKTYFTYKRKSREVKRELVEFASSLLPLMNKTASNALSFVNFILHIMNECGNLEGEELLSAIIGELADKFETDAPRLYEIIQYIATMNKDDIQKIIINAMIETNPTFKNEDE